MWDKNYWLSGTEKRRASGIREADEPASARGENPSCCAQPMNPRLAHAHDRLGRKVFVAVWRCQVCGRVALGSR